jgi:hypothetical protein
MHTVGGIRCKLPVGARRSLPRKCKPFPMFSSLAEFSAAIMQSRDETKKGARPNPHVVLLGAVGGTASAEKNPERASRLPSS